MRVGPDQLAAHVGKRTNTGGGKIGLAPSFPVISRHGYKSGYEVIANAIAVLSLQILFPIFYRLSPLG